MRDGGQFSALPSLQLQTQTHTTNRPPETRTTPTAITRLLCFVVVWHDRVSCVGGYGWKERSGRWWWCCKGLHIAPPAECWTFFGTPAQEYCVQLHRPRVLSQFPIRCRDLPLGRSSAHGADSRQSTLLYERLHRHTHTCLPRGFKMLLPPQSLLLVTTSDNG